MVEAGDRGSLRAMGGGATEDTRQSISVQAHGFRKSILLLDASVMVT